MCTRNTLSMKVSLSTPSVFMIARSKLSLVKGNFYDEIRRSKTMPAKLRVVGSVCVSCMFWCGRSATVPPTPAIAADTPSSLQPPIECVPDLTANPDAIVAVKKQLLKVGGAPVQDYDEASGCSIRQRVVGRGVTIDTSDKLGCSNELTGYQVWVMDRVAAWQLLLYFTARESDPGCRKLSCFRSVKKAMQHIF
uniref:RxLR effector candidate protein n=1 Tax=Hyaloperonospora arabidopsidis (strain Emoy2) TaxID=559515 RepID=M4BRU8_HYAAE